MNPPQPGHAPVGLRLSPWFIAVSFLMVACGGGGGGRSFDREATLESIAFLDPWDVNLEEPSEAPQSAPLVQQIEFTFSGQPNPGQLDPRRIVIEDQSTGKRVAGTYEVTGHRVVFTPDLPTIEAREGAEGDAGLAPDRFYHVAIGPNTWPEFIARVNPELRAAYPHPTNSSDVFLTFRTTTVVEHYYLGLEPRRPRLVSSDPSDGASQVTPGLYRDPEGLFPKRRKFHMKFDGPLQPTKENLSGFLLVDLDDRPAHAPLGVTLGVDVRLVSNELGMSLVEIEPSGILPFGHLLALEYPVGLRGLSDAGDAASGTRIAATFTVAAAPRSTIRDTLIEDFDGKGRRNLDALEPGVVAAQWDEFESNVLQPSFNFHGNGELGRFIPFPPDRPTQPRKIVLDTTSQEFPLSDGSTPDAPSGMTIVGGVFPFTDIDIPEGVHLEPRGPNPLVLAATGSVRISGSILMDAQNGTNELNVDSATTSRPGGRGGPGGGRGGEGQPSVFRGNFVRKLNQISPPSGGHGWGPRDREQIGGRGGESGTLDRNIGREKYLKPEGEDCPPDWEEVRQNGKSFCRREVVDDSFFGKDHEIQCAETLNTHSNGYKPPGGGGGSFLNRGGRRPHGIGNVLADGQGGYILRTPATHEDYDVLRAGIGGDAVFGDDDRNNNFIGPRGEVTEVIGGQGGGAGGSALDSYYCGHWCKNDDDPRNDRICIPERFFGRGPPWRFASSVEDARGGSGGGGGGALSIEALGPIEFTGSCRIRCGGGRGGGGESIGCGNFSGSGGGGSGGAILVRSATSVTVRPGVRFHVLGGKGAPTTSQLPGAMGCSTLVDEEGNELDPFQYPGAGGDGSAGIVQLQVPLGKVATVEDFAFTPRRTWLDSKNLLNPTEFTNVSVAVSDWYDLGRVIRRPPVGTNPVFRFQGLDEQGYVLTDDHGNVFDPKNADIRVDFLGQEDPLKPGSFLPGGEPRSHYVPPGTTVRVEFQGASAVADGAREIDPDSITPAPGEWAPTPAVANGQQFVRYRVTFDLAADGGEVTPETSRPTVQRLSIHAEF